MTRCLTCRKSVIHFRPVQAVEVPLTGRIDNIEFQPSQHLDDGANLQRNHTMDSSHPKLWWCMGGRLAASLEETTPSMMMMMMWMHLEDLEDLTDQEVKMDSLLLMMGGS